METEGAPPRRTAKEYGYLFFSGAAMGAADVVPGVSGGTMAFILGVYEELINSIKAVNIRLVQHVLRGRIAAAWAQVHGDFLVALGAGLVGALFSLAGLLTWLLEYQPVNLYAFFFGLIVASIVAISAHVHWRPTMWAALVLGGVLAYWVVGLVPAEMEPTPVALFFSGAVAICAMILPGISGSFILLILGQYGNILGAVKDLNLAILLPAMAGMAVGILSFSRVLSWLLKHYHNVTVAILIGFMIGSLRRIWPFKETVSWMTDRHGEQVPREVINVLPSLDGSLVWTALGLAVLGFVLITALDHMQSRNNPVLRIWSKPAH
jgi:putative membrane protein